MEFKDILGRVDHTLLTQSATWEEIRALCDDAIEYGTASVCIPASYVRQAKEYVGDRMAVCTVIGFPNGYSTTRTKVFEAKDAVENGADEIDMVINIGWVKDGLFQQAQEEIRQIKQAVGDRILKVIIETCLLSEEEKIRMCRIVTAAGADYIKTSTGFSKAGATPSDVRLFAAHVGKNVRIKAAGGISSLEDARKFLELGADRLGTSRIVKLAKESGCTGEEYINGLPVEQMVEKAMGALRYAYAPYSHFKVAAALLTEDGEIYTGCNIENAAYSPGNCAERTAVFKAVSEGRRDFKAICIVNEGADHSHDYCAPCGVCRQVMMEFCDPKTFVVILARGAGDYRSYLLEELLPFGFGPDNLKVR